MLELETGTCYSLPYPDCVIGRGSDKEFCARSGTCTKFNSIDLVGMTDKKRVDPTLKLILRAKLDV